MTRRLANGLYLLALACCGLLAPPIVNAADSDVLTADLPGGQQLVLAHPRRLQAAVNTADPRAVTVRLAATSGQDAVSLMLTFFANPRARAPSRDQSAEMVARMAAPYLASSVEGRVGLWEYDTSLGTAILTTLTDARYADRPAPPGEYATVSVGQVVTDELAVAITLLSNDTETQLFGEALAVIAAMMIVPDNATATGMPPPPAGYQWQVCPEIMGALLRPDGWYFKKRIDGNNRAYFITREDLDTAGGFTAGLSVVVKVGYGREKNVEASEFAKNYIAYVTERAEIRKPAWTTSRGPFVSHGVVLTERAKGNTVLHTLVIGNDDTGTVYFVTFQGPEREWEALRTIGLPMLERLYIESEI